MTDQPRRHKLDSELTADERAIRARFGQSGRQFERPEYVQWRSRTLADERDNLVLRGVLLEQQAELLRERAGDRRMAARERLTVEDHLSAMRVRNDGGEVEPPDDDGAAGFEADADELDREAQEIATYLAHERDLGEAA